MQKGCVRPKGTNRVMDEGERELAQPAECAAQPGHGHRCRIAGASPTANICKNTREGRTNEKAENASGANEKRPQRGPIASRKKS